MNYSEKTRLLYRTIATLKSPAFPIFPTSKITPVQRYLLPLLFCWFTLPLVSQSTPAKKTPSIAEKIEGLQKYPGYHDFYWSEEEGKIYLAVTRWDEDFLYVNSLSAGVGSNDIGLDRNQLGSNRVVRWQKIGPKVLLLERNLDYRAVSDNPDERQSVADAFAQSVLAGFKVEAATDNEVLIDLTPLLMTDAHGVASRLKRSKQGTFKIDPLRSAIHLDRTKNFPQNSEFEALLTFAGEAEASQLRSVTPNSEAFSVRMHHSFVQLPDDKFEPRVYDPRSGYFDMSYADYATPIDQPLVKRFIRKHRLVKKDPAAAVSEPVEPIVYYLDRGAPEPIRSALIEGAAWWDQAFAAAGYQNAFQVKLLPEDADPLDVRYNVINWVHRSTRGWSYGSSVVDPRTGEIIKGHVLLGSLRVRQDFLIAQGMVEAYQDGTDADPRLLELALARLRQLSAHEVGHTIGLAHNFAASINDRASVMDYPHPYVTLKDGKIDFSEAYAVGIGEWDKRTILYGYQDFKVAKDQNRAEFIADQLQEILAENERMNFLYVSDPDSRAPSTANADGHLWDNGKSPVEELKRLSEIRAFALDNFGLPNIMPGAPVSSLENVFVPVYLMHRYQVEGASKLIGGYHYSYAVRTANTPEKVVYPVSATTQQEALEALLMTISPAYLAVPPRIQQLLPPQAYGYQRDRELFNFYTAGTFDAIAAAEAAAEHTLSHLLHPARLARIENQPMINLENYLLTIFKSLRSNLGNKYAELSNGKQISQAVYFRFFQHLLQLAANKEVSSGVRSAAIFRANEMVKEAYFGDGLSSLIDLTMQQFRENPEAFKAAPAKQLPDGSPIGCGGVH